MSQVNESGVDEAVITKQPSPQPNPTDTGGHQTQTTTKTKRGNALEELEKLDKVILSQEISACKREYSSFLGLFKMFLSRLEYIIFTSCIL